MKLICCPLSCFNCMCVCLSNVKNVFTNIHYFKINNIFTMKSNSSIRLSMRCVYTMHSFIYVPIIEMQTHVFSTNFSQKDCAQLKKGGKKCSLPKSQNQSQRKTLPMNVFFHLFPVAHNFFPKNVSINHAFFSISPTDIWYVLQFCECYAICEIKCTNT